MAERFHTRPNEGSEVEIVQNAALGGVLLWEFGRAYQRESLNRPCLLPYMFLVLPLTFHKPTLQHVLSTQKRSGLALFAAKLSERREDLLAIHPRAVAMRRLSLSSLAMAVRKRLISVHYETATVRANEMSAPAPPTGIKPMLTGAEKLGTWTARLAPHEFAAMLRVEF